MAESAYLHRQSLRSIAKLLLSPVVTDFSRWLRAAWIGRQGFREWEAVADTDDVWTKSPGWEHPSIAEAELRRWSNIRSRISAPRPFEDWRQHLITAFAYALALASCGRDGISVLDWGGGVGMYRLYAGELYPNLKLDYLIKDLPALCAIGKQHVPEANFESEDQIALSRRYDLGSRLN